MKAEIPPALVLAGGLGTRLKGVVDDRPKPMALVAGRPFLEWLVLRARAQGVCEITFCTGHMGEAVEEYFGDGRKLGVALHYSREKTPIGTGGALRLAIKDTPGEEFLVLNGDSYCPYDLRRLNAFHAATSAAATLWVVPTEDCARFGAVRVSSSGSILSFTEKDATKGPGLVNAGVYILDRGVVEEIPDGRCVSLEREVLPSLIGHGLSAVTGEGYFIDIGTPESYAQADAFMKCEQLG